MTKHWSWFACLALPLAIAACDDDGGLTGDDDLPPPPPGDAAVPVVCAGSSCEIVGDITADTRLEAAKTYVLKTYIFVTGGTLTIEPGTVIRGENGTALAITRNAKINAVGTVDKPIVFTSNKSTPKSGDWGGVVLLGKAQINVAGGEDNIEGFPESFGDRVLYGGGATPDNAHDCGKLKYVRIEYAGFLLAPGNELQNLTLGACGTATEIDFVQSHLGSDDGVEIFGGTVNVRHLVITQPDDDGLDSDLGWRGNAQFVVIQQKAGRGDKGFEFDNHPTVTDAKPRNVPEVWNVTVIGGDGPASEKKQGGFHLRRGTGAKINNAVVAFWNAFAVDIDGAPSASTYGQPDLLIQNTYFVKSASADLWPTSFDVVDGAQNDPLGGGAFFDEAAVIGGPTTTNHLDVDVKLADPKNLAAPNWKPAADSPVLTGCGTPGPGFDTTATFCGAIGATDWTQGWTRYPN